MKKSTIIPVKEATQAAPSNVSSPKQFSDLASTTLPTSSGSSFLSTSKGKAILSLAIVIPSLLVAGGVAGGLSYYFVSLESSVMSTTERTMLMSLGNFKDMKLIYRASRDGRHGAYFHLKCDYIPNTVSVFKSGKDYVFGGYTSVAWNSSNQYVSDESAFLFSLRRKGVTLTQGERFNVRNSMGQWQNAIYDYWSYGPVFGSGHDLFVYFEGSYDFLYGYTSFCQTYECGANLNNQSSSTQESQAYLAGTYNFVVLDYEVYQVTF